MNRRAGLRALILRRLTLDDGEDDVVVDELLAELVDLLLLLKDLRLLRALLLREVLHS